MDAAPSDEMNLGLDLVVPGIVLIARLPIDCPLAALLSFKVSR